MSLIPDFEIGVWNAWILQVIFFIFMSIPELFTSKEAKVSTKRATESIPLSKTHKRLALSTHIIIMPLSFIYCVFLPLKLGTAWLYVGLLIFALALIMTIITSINFATTPPNEPVTKGIYRISRHPIYLGAFLFYLGIGIASASWPLLLFALAWIIIWNIVVPEEEQILTQKYGDSYRDYLKRTQRWIGIPKSIK